jgi:hypothetical protein
MLAGEKNFTIIPTPLKFGALRMINFTAAYFISIVLFKDKIHNYLLLYKV